MSTLNQTDVGESDVTRHIATVRNEISRLEQMYGRESGSVDLLAVSKTKPAELVRAAAAESQLESAEFVHSIKA